MLGINLALTPNERTIILESLSTYVPNVSETAQIIYVKTCEIIQKNSIVDGMYMRCMENALNFVGDKLSETKHKELARKIESKRLEFQYEQMQHLFSRGA